MRAGDAAGQLRIREIGDADLDRVVDLWREAGVQRPWNDPARDIAFARRGPNSTLLVAERDDAIVGTVMVGEDGHRGWVYYLAVDPARQRKGIGRAIMAAAEDWLRARGVWKLQLLIREENAAVQRFYEALGYRDVRTVCMQKVIG